MNVIYFNKHFLLKKITALVLAFGLVLSNLLPSANVFASFSGGGMGAVGPQSPGYEFDGLYTVEQNSSELTPNSSGVYVISDYNTAPTIWINRAMVNSGDPFYVRNSYRVYDENDSIIESLSQTVGHNSNYNTDYDVTTLSLSIRGKYTDYILELYDLDSNGGQGENLLETIEIRLAYADYDPERIPSITITDVRQAGEHLSATDPYGGDNWIVYYDNRLDLEVDYRIENLLPGMQLRAYINSEELIIENSNYYQTINYYTGFSPQSFSTNYRAFSDQYNYSYENHERVYFMSSTQEETPYYTIDMVDLETGEKVDDESYPDSYFVNISVYDYEERPIGIKIEGHNYEENTEYTINLTTSSRIGETSYETITKTGSELNNTIVIPYDHKVGPFTIQELQTQHINEQGYDVICNIGYSTKALGFYYYPLDFWVVSDMFNADGKPFLQYSSTNAAGDAGLIYGVVNIVYISSSLLSDNLYLGLNTNQSEYDDYDIYLFRSNDTSNDFTNKELLMTTSFTANTPLIINVGTLPESGTTYSAVFVHDGLVDFVNHYQVIIDNDTPIDEVNRLTISLSSENAPVYQSGLNSFSSVFDNAIDAQILMTNTDENKEYQLKVKGVSNDYDFENTINGSELDGLTTLFSLPAQPSDGTSSGKTYDISVLYDDKAVSESRISIYYTDSESILNRGRAYGDLLSAAHDQIVSQIPGTFNAVLTAPETFDNEFDVYLTVKDYENIIGSCNGICGLVGELQYDNTEIELVSADPLNDFEIEQGNKIVLYRPTGVSDGTDIMKLHFRNLTLSANESTTISLNNIEGSDGVNNIPTESTTLSIEHVVPIRHISTHTFTNDDYGLVARAGSITENGEGSLYAVPINSISNNNAITIYYDGYGFDTDSIYTYILKNNVSGQELHSGEVSGADLENGLFNIRGVHLSTESDSEFELLIYSGSTLIYSHTDIYRNYSNPDLVIGLGYGYSDAGIVNGYHTIPYGVEMNANLISYGLDDNTTYEVSYIAEDYDGCSDSVQDGHYTEICSKDDLADEISGTISATGEELNSGKIVTLPAPESTTTRRYVEFTIKNLNNNPTQAVAFREAYINYVEPSTVVNDIEGYTVKNDDMVIGGIALESTVSTLRSNFALNNNYLLIVSDKDGNFMHNNDIVGTGDKITVKDVHNQSVIEYSAIIKGDISGDGRVTILDLVQAKRDLAGITKAEGIYAEAGDVTNSGFIGITDVVKICRHVAGLEEIRQ